MHWLSKTRYKIGFLIPTLLAYTVFIVLPIIIAIGYSFTKYSGIGKAHFNGLTNYIRLFRDKVFWKSLQNTVVIFVVASVLLLVLSFLLALLLNNKLKLVDTSKALIFSPAIIAPIIVGIIWFAVLNATVGLRRCCIVRKICCIGNSLMCYSNPEVSGASCGSARTSSH